MTFTFRARAVVAARAALLAVGALLVAGAPCATPLVPERASAAGSSLQFELQPTPIRPERPIRPDRPIRVEMPDPAIAQQREALHQHLKELGMSAETTSAILSRIGIAAQQGIVPTDEIALSASSALDVEAEMKAIEMLTAFAELCVFGEPVSWSLDVQGAPRIEARPGTKTLGVGEIELPGMEPSEIPEARIGGTCLTCPSFDFSITPSAVYQTHSAALTPGFADCAWYAVPVTLGRRYEFTTCSPGAATWDTVIEIHDSAACGTVVAMNDDCSPPPAILRQSTVIWDATFTGSARVKVRGYDSVIGGAYTLAYRDLGIVCDTCTVPNPAVLAVPQAAPTCVSGSTTSTCRNDFYEVVLTAGETYMFTTCPNNAPGATSTYDTVLRLWSPSCGLLASNDDSCPTVGFTSRSTLNYTATTSGPHRIEVTGRIFGGLPLFGSYTLCYRRTSASCAGCGPGPFLGTFTPFPSCQDHSSNVTACQDNWYRFVLQAGVEYEFTTCNTPSACTTGGSNFDTVLELHDFGCNLVAMDDDGCGGTSSRITYTVPAGMGGIYRVLVKGKSGVTGTYTLTYREVTQACVAPTALALGPGGGLTDPLNCARTQAFTLATDGDATLPVSYAWSVTPPAGGVAVPPSGTLVSSVPNGAAGFSTTLSREGTYTIDVTVTNDCGSHSQSFVYELVDDVKPVVTAPAGMTVECDAVPSPGTPTVRDNCDPSPAVELTETTVAGPCPGSYAIRRQWVATDRAGNVSAPAFQVVVVRDTTPPTLSSDLSVRYCAYPPNHDVVCFDRSMFSPTVTDNCSDPVSWRFFRVTSSEQGLSPCGSGNQEPDVHVAADGSSFCIRVERCGNDPAENDGRRYFVEAVATDACGNTSAPMPIGFILVPHDNSNTAGCIYPVPIPLP